MIWKRDKGKIEKVQEKIKSAGVRFTSPIRLGAAPLNKAGGNFYSSVSIFGSPQAGPRLRRFSLSWKASVGCKSRCAITFPRFSPGLPISRSGAFQTVLARHS